MDKCRQCEGTGSIPIRGRDVQPCPACDGKGLAIKRDEEIHICCASGCRSTADYVYNGKWYCWYCLYNRPID